MEHSPINTIPAELRLNIYELVVHEPQGIHLKAEIDQGVRFGRFKPEDRDLCDCFNMVHLQACACLKVKQSQLANPDADGLRHRQSLLAITQTCKQIHEESDGLFYSLNVFHWHPSRWAEEWNNEEESWPPPQTGSSPDDANLCRLFLSSLGAQNVELMKRFVIEGPQWLPPPFAEDSPFGE